MKKVKLKKVKFGELEDTVMKCVWALSDEEQGSLVDVKSIINSLKELNAERDYVYTTIHTTCLRLCKKNRLEKVQIKNKYYYKPIETKEFALKKDLQMLADKYFEGDIEATITALKDIIC